MTTNTVPKGWDCECGAHHDFGVYVLAHWDMELTHTCPDCGRKHSVFRGKVELIPEEKKRRKG